MINRENFEQLLIKLGFSESENQYVYRAKDRSYTLKADLETQTLSYPGALIIPAYAKKLVTRFQNENFVVFECVFRLLKQGYRPEQITLEPKWIVGHGQNGGRADILIKDNDEKSFLIIECKTYGEEFNKYWHQTELNGGQLFSYAQQELDTRYLCMYASDLCDDAVVYTSHIISLVDNDVFLNSLQNPIAFRNAKSAAALYSVWRDTYDREYAAKGIFEDGIAPFEVGKKVYTVDDLTLVNSADIQKKYHEFATIMRQHNVAGRENAFDKLVNLFLAKIVDEIQNPEKLQFYWKGLAFDDYFSLHNRIQGLYKKGMEDFLGEEVTYVDNQTIEEAFGLVKTDPDATKEKILTYIRQLKFFTNNNFAFLDVHNEHLFYKNSEILYRVVRMLQDIKLKTEEPNQFLGDLFEGFLDQGVKQSEGQYFTPLPIVKFLVSSLPLKELSESLYNPPTVLDYACGAGHFLNEYASQIRSLVDKSLLPRYFHSIFGIEKEYLLSKVAKVSSYMYGQDGINIIYGDALSDKINIPKSSVNILIANPPYSVKGFLATLLPEERKKYEVFSTIGDSGIMASSAIETFFLERAAQLMAPNGVAAIILPLTILSNGAAAYVKAREILLKHFDIIAIAEFGGLTFGKTGTNTVTLFLRKKPENPPLHLHYQYRVAAWFTGDTAADSLYADSDLPKAYCNQIGVDFSLYETLFTGSPCRELFETELFAEYRAEFSASTAWKNRTLQKSFREQGVKEQEEEFEKKLYEYITASEKEKMYYFALAAANPQPVLVVRAPAKSSEQKEFLGYDWSGAKGSEGIKYLGVKADPESVLLKNKGIDCIETPLFNPADLYDRTKINSMIRDGFTGRQSTAENPYVTQQPLTKMLNFSKTSFDKSLSLIGTPIIEIETDFEKVPLKELVLTLGGLWTGKKPPFITVGVLRNTNFTMQGKLNMENVAMLQVEKKAFEKRRLQPGDIIIEKSGGSKTQAVGRVVLFNQTEGKYAFSNFTACLRCTDGRLLPGYLHIMMNALYHAGLTFPFQTGSSGLKNLKLNDYLQTKIPVPPKEIQKKLIAACEKIDTEYEKTRMMLEDYQKSVEALLRSLKIISGKGMRLK